MSMRSDTFDDPNREVFKLGEDYFSYALFAFFLFDERERMVVGTETRFTEKSIRRAMSIASNNKRAISGEDFTPMGSLLSNEKVLTRSPSHFERNSADDMTKGRAKESFADQNIDMQMQERSRDSLIKAREDLEIPHVKFSAPSSEATSRTDDPDIDLQFLRYSRRLRNRSIFFNALFIFVMEMAMIIFVVKYYNDYGTDYTLNYGTVVLKYMCAIALHLMQQPQVLQSIYRL